MRKKGPFLHPCPAVWRAGAKQGPLAAKAPSRTSWLVTLLSVWHSKCPPFAARGRKQCKDAAAGDGGTTACGEVVCALILLRFYSPHSGRLQRSAQCLKQKKTQPESEKQ